MIVDDYAHHPTEVRATLAAARQAFPRRRVVAVFQPHLFSRTALHGEALGEHSRRPTSSSSRLIYAAREQPMPGVTAEIVARGAIRAGAATTAVRERAARVRTGWRVWRSRGTSCSRSGAGISRESGPELIEKLGKREGEEGRVEEKAPEPTRATERGSGRGRGIGRWVAVCRHSARARANPVLPRAADRPGGREVPGARRADRGPAAAGRRERLRRHASACRPAGRASTVWPMPSVVRRLPGHARSQGE